MFSSVAGGSQTGPASRSFILYFFHQAEDGLHALASDHGAAQDVALILGLRRPKMVLPVPCFGTRVLLVMAGYRAVEIEAARSSAS